MNTATQDKTEIPQNWTFKDESVASNFNAHVSSQLPWYGMATQLIAHLATHYLPEKGRMYDLGTSTGNITKALASVLDGRSVDTVGLDNSKEMLNKWDGYGRTICTDLAKFEPKPFDVGVCFLTLMFLPPVEQEKTLKRFLTQMREGGCFIMFEKTVAADGYLGVSMFRFTMAQKYNQGVSLSAILEKELSLIGVQRPIKDSIFNQEGVKVTQIFQFGDFKGWVFEKV